MTVQIVSCMEISRLGSTILSRLHVSFCTGPEFLPLDVDSINENDSVANPDPTPRIASVHKSRFAEVVLVGCWMEAVYYGLLLFTIT